MKPELSKRVIRLIGCFFYWMSLWQMTAYQAIDNVIKHLITCDIWHTNRPSQCLSMLPVFTNVLHASLHVTHSIWFQIFVWSCWKAAVTKRFMITSRVWQWACKIPCVFADIWKFDKLLCHRYYLYDTRSVLLLHRPLNLYWERIEND